MKNEYTTELRLADGRAVRFTDLRVWEKVRGGTLEELPAVVKILLESVVRNLGGDGYRREHAEALACWQPDSAEREPGVEIPYLPARVLLQDLTGVPCVVDLASLRSAVVRAGGEASWVEPRIPVDMVVDHSVQVDCAGSRDALAKNMEIEFRRNRERYEFLRWGQGTFQKLRIVPPGVGICHQVNLEYLARAVQTEELPDGSLAAWPDTLVGTDSHTTMVNGLGVLGWGVGGIEAEAAMLGQPIALRMPVVTGVRLRGALRPGATATDLALAMTRRLREAGVVGQFVEYFGDGCASLALADRAVLANMAPEYGATTGFFAPDAASVAYLRMTGRGEEHCRLVEAVLKAQGIFREDGAPETAYTRVIDFDLAAVEPAVAGPKRPHDFQTLHDLLGNFRRALSAPKAEGGFGAADPAAEAALPGGGALRHGSVVIASITSCTNTSNPALLLAAGLVAKAAAERGMEVPRHVKTSLVPGSRVVADYLADTGLLAPLESLGFAVAAYGCGTCIGNSGPVAPEIAAAVAKSDLVAAAVLSGNRNFEGRVHPVCKANYLASPPLVVAYALAGRVDVDLENEPLGKDRDGRDVFLRDLWPAPADLAPLLARANDPARYAAAYRDVNAFAPAWSALPAAESATFGWQPDSTYIREAPFIAAKGRGDAVEGARVLGFFGDFITTDHISPAGAIAADSPAAKWLEAHGVARVDFNSYGSRRGNHEIMARGTFANIRLKNRLSAREGGWTTHFPSGESMAIFDAAERYRAEGVPVVVLAGKMYGAGSSRDWAAKGPLLLGVRAVVAESFERIHRSNLVEMGILPLEFLPGESAGSHGLDGTETFSVRAKDGALRPNGIHVVTARRADGSEVSFEVRNRIDTPVEVEYFREGGILPFVLRQLLEAHGK
jgi:aconitate hydratase